MNRRLYFIDILKGGAIIGVIAGHIASYNPLCTIIISIVYSFHMSLFFFISGFLYSLSSQKDTIYNIKKKTMTLLLPYMSISFLAFILHGCSAKAFMGYYCSETRWGYWFLPSLFIMFVFLITLRNRCSSNRRFMSFAILLELCFVFLKYVLPTFFTELFLIRHLITYWPFIVFGMFANRLKTTNFGILLSGTFWIGIIMMNYYSIMNNEILRTVGRICAIICMYSIFSNLSNKKLAKREFIIDAGSSSLVIYMFHYFMLPVVEPYMRSLSQGWYANTAVIFLSISIVAVCMVVHKYIINRNILLSKLFLGK